VRCQLSALSFLGQARRHPSLVVGLELDLPPQSALDILITALVAMAISPIRPRPLQSAASSRNSAIVATSMLFSPSRHCYMTSKKRWRFGKVNTDDYGITIYDNRWATRILLRRLEVTLHMKNDFHVEQEINMVFCVYA